MEGKIEQIENPEYGKLQESFLQVKNWPYKLYWVEIVCLLIAGLTLVAFCLGRSLLDNFNGAIDAEVWGQFGDFIGGVIGTLISYISIRLLVANLSEQRKANKQQEDSFSKSTEVYEIQQFNEMFRLLFDQYREAVTNYKTVDGVTGKQALSKIVGEIKKHAQDITGDTYEEREQQALKIFDSFYVTYHDVAPVHFRILYRLFQLIDESKIPEEKRRDVAKIMRCQLSKEELFLLRYNAKSPYGAKMQLYINRYNLLKHLPTLELLEFSPIRTKLNDEVLCNRLNAELANICKITRELLLRKDDETKKSEIKYSDRYKVKIEVSADNKTFRLELEKNGAGSTSTSKTDIDAAFEGLEHDHIRKLVYDLACEIFVYSNFAQYNKFAQLNISHDSNSQESARITTYYVEVTNRNGYPLVCAQKQLDAPLAAGQT